MHPVRHAQTTPDKPALIMAASGETLTYRQLDALSNQGAQLFRKLGLRTGDCIAIFMENNLLYLPICWAAQRAGLYFTCISSRLTAGEVEYIVKDSGAKILIASRRPRQSRGRGDGAPARREATRRRRRDPGFRELRSTPPARCPRRRSRTKPPASTCSIRPARRAGPKACASPLQRPADRCAESALIGLVQGLFGFSRGHDLSFAGAALSRGPVALFHDGPAPRRHGDRDGAFRRRSARLHIIEQYQANASQWVPTMFVRMLKLPDEVRLKYDVSSMKSADPCRGALSDRRQAQDDRMVGTGDARILRRHRRQWLLLCRQRRLAGPSRHRRQIAARRNPHLRRRRQGSAGRRGRHDLFRRRDAVQLSQRSEEDGGVAPSRASRLVDARRCRQAGQRRLSLSDRSQGVHDHLGWREHLSAGSGEPADLAIPRSPTSP